MLGRTEGDADRSLAYWCRPHVEIRMEATRSFLLPLGREEYKIGMRIELIALLDVAGVGRHGTERGYRERNISLKEMRR